MSRTRGLAAALLLLSATLVGMLSGCRTQEPSSGARQSVATPGLEAFFTALSGLESGTRQEPLRIVMIGDSHTATDDFSGELRRLLQGRFGDAGRGFLAAGVPYDYYEPRGIAVAQSDGWEAFTSLKRDDEGFFGLSGFRLEAEEADETMTLIAVPGQEFDQASVTLLMQPGGGRVEVSVDGRALAILESEGGFMEARRFDLPIDARASSLTLTTLDDAPVTLLAWTIERDRPGIVLDSIGVGGATVAIFDRWDPATWRRELRERAPDLVILAFGTNEGFNSDWTAESYGALFRDQLSQVRAAAPGASLLVVGPPDGNRRFRACRKIEDFEDVCAPLDAEETARYEEMLEEKRPSGAACRWHPPPNLAVVRTVQRQVAAQQGLFFWDWSEVMGGTCGTHAWSQQEPPLAWNDHVHLREAGYEISGRRLYDELMQRYAGWRPGTRP